MKALAGPIGRCGALPGASPGTPPFVEDRTLVPESVSEKLWVKINGADQGMFIESRDASHPVLLFLHGGLPEYFLTQRYPTKLENEFTVVWWEQRGSGLSYDPSASPAAITADQLISDTLAITDYLRHRFGQPKIYLMGHSGGSFIGIQAAARAPERYHAYVGVGQMVNQLRSETLAYNYMLKQYAIIANRKMVRKLEASPVSIIGGVSPAYLGLRDRAMHDLGIGTMHAMRSVFTGIIVPSLLFREYTIGDKINLWRGKSSAGVSAVWDTMLATDLTTAVPELHVPVYFLEGVHDYTCSYAVAKAYFLRLKAPVKGFYSFQQSAHSPMFEEPERVRKILREDVLAGGNSLADRIMSDANKSQSWPAA